MQPKNMMIGPPLDVFLHRRQISVSVIRMRGGAGTGVEGTTEAIVSLFGRTATLVVPTGRDNVADLLEIFVKLDTSLSEMKQENKVLKETVARHEAEIGRLQVRRWLVRFPNSLLSELGSLIRGYLSFKILTANCFPS